MVKVSDDVPINKTGLWCRIYINVVKDACKSPIVLSLEIKSVGILDNKYSKGVVPLLNERCDIIFGRLLRSFVVAYFLTVYPKK